MKWARSAYLKHSTGHQRTHPMRCYGTGEDAPNQPHWRSCINISIRWDVMTCWPICGKDGTLSNSEYLKREYIKAQHRTHPMRCYMTGEDAPNQPRWRSWVNISIRWDVIIMTCWQICVKDRTLSNSAKGTLHISRNENWDSIFMVKSYLLALKCLFFNIQLLLRFGILSHHGFIQL